jgi:site-specific DNA-methyltransferase (adenine-specific)
MESVPVHDRYGSEHRRRANAAGLRNEVVWESNSSIAEKPPLFQVPKAPGFDLDVANEGDALALLRAIDSESTKLTFWDAQYRQLLQKLCYGNEGVSRGRRRKMLPAMTQEYIAACDREIARISTPSGYCARWVDEYQLLNGLFVIEGMEQVGVVHWDNGKPGTGKRIRPVGGSLVFLQKPPTGARAKAIQVKWATEPMIRGVRKETIRFPMSAHPHRKPIGLIADVIKVVTEPGDTVVDPAAGSFVVMAAALGCHRHFLGTDILPTTNGGVAA